MGTESWERKLVAILYADVAGYSRLMREDEDATHQTVSTDLDLITSLIHNHHGRVGHYAGDAVLADFDTVLDAMRSAADIQSALKANNENVLPERQVQFRIGVNLGDVIVDRGEVHGDGVNVAARLENLAKPGGICISESVRTAVGSRLPLDYEFLGEQKVKNIKEPVRAYRVSPVASTVPIEAPTGTQLRRRIVLAGAAIAALAIVVSYYIIGAAQHDNVTEANKPTVAILPFKDLSKDASSIYLANGITEEIITDLSKVSAVNVISRNSTSQFKTVGLVPDELYDELSARYVLMGGVQAQEDADRIVVNANLIDTTSGESLWAEKHDVELNSVFELQDALVGKIVDVMAVRVSAAEQSRIAERETSNIGAYEGFNKAWQLFQKNTPQELGLALLELLKVVEIDPSYAKAYAAIGHIYFKSWLWGWESYANTDFNSAPGLAKQFLDKSLEIRPSAVAHQLSANIALYDRRFDEAREQALTAITLEPSGTNGLLTMAEILIYMGLQKDALPYVEKVSRLDPLNPAYVSFLFGLTEFGEEQYGKAVQHLEKAISENPEDFAPAAPLTAAYAIIGDEENMQRALERYLKGWPSANIRDFRIYWPFQHKIDEDRLLNGLRVAGMREH